MRLAVANGKNEFFDGRIDSFENFGWKSSFRRNSTADLCKTYVSKTGSSVIGILLNTSDKNSNSKG